MGDFAGPLVQSLQSALDEVITRNKGMCRVRIWVPLKPWESDGYYAYWTGTGFHKHLCKSILVFREEAERIVDSFGGEIGEIGKN